MSMEGRVECEGSLMLIILPIIVSIFVVFLDVVAIIFADVNQHRSEDTLAAIVIVISGILILFHIWRSYFAFISQVGAC